MATREEIFTAKIMINDAEAENKLQKMKQHLAELKKKRDEAFANDNVTLWKTLDKEINSVSKKIDKQETLVKGLNHTLDKMSTAKQKELKQVIAAINKQLDSGAVERNSKQWKDLNAVLKDAKSELHKIRAEGENQPSIWSKFFKVLNDSWGGVLIIFQSITGLSQTVRNAVKDFASMEEAMANTRKYTGLTDGAIRDLNEDLKKMDTRTSREELNELAGAAGRLGITGKEGILDFVEAGNMIKVALGDDLGEGAIDKVGKLAMAFGEDENMGLRRAMIATGSAINELAQNSSAQAGYLVDFTARVAGFGKQLGLTQAQIMGFGAVMDENLLRDEMAATAFGNMLTKMQTDTAKFAKIAGMDVKKFTDLLNTDANAAILALADNLKKADPQTMMKMLDDMGLDGSRAVGVLSTLADKIDDVRQRQELATQAYKEQQSVVNEYNTMNNTVEAQLEKNKKKFHELVVTLGGQLLPVVNFTISAGGMLAKALSILTSFVINNWKAIVVLTSGIAAYSVAVNFATIKEKVHLAIMAVRNGYHKVEAALIAAKTTLMTAWGIVVDLVTGKITLATAAQQMWNTVIAANPIGAAVTAVMALVAAIILLTEKQNAVAEAQKTVNDIRKEAKEKVQDEITEINLLVDAAENEMLTLEERQQAIDKLNQKIPDYNGKLDKTRGKYIANKKALDDYINSLIRMYEVIGAKEKLTELGRQRVDLTIELTELQALYKKERERVAKETAQASKSPQTSGGAVAPSSFYGAIGNSGELKSIANNIADINSQIDVIDAKTKVINDIWGKDMQKSMATAEQQAPDFDPHKDDDAPDYTSGSGTKSGGGKNSKVENKAEKERKERAAAAKAEFEAEIAEEMAAYRQGITTYSDYMRERHNIAQNYYEAMKKIYGEDSTEYKKLLDDRERMEGSYYDWLNKQNETSVEIDRIEREQAIRQEYASRQVYDEDELNEALFESDMQYLKDKQSVYQEGSKKWEEIQTEMILKEKEHQLELEEKYIDRLNAYREKAGLVSYQELLKMELESVEKIYKPLVDLGKMTKEEYDAIIAHIKQEYASLEADQISDNSIENKAAKALETAKKKAQGKDYEAGDNAASGIYSITQAIGQQKTINEELKKLYGEDYENNKEYQEAKRQLDAETMQKIVAGAQAAYSSINTMMSAASGYAQACSDLEVAKITANYDKQIAAAGKNSKKKEKLEKKKDEAIAKAKTKANKKAMTMELAQAIAQTAMGAISAYTSTMAGAPYPANLVLAPISAGIALAAGMLQVATIKKQHQAESTGYYEGGYTGGRQYRKEAGVVHEGEFVANHKAVNNRELRPVLNLIDQAQRHNRVASLRAEDVTKVMGGTAAAVVAPVVNVQTDNEELRSSIDGMNESMDRLNYNLENPRDVVFSMERFDREQKKWNRMKSNV